MYPLTHAHADETHSVLARALVQSTFVAHTMPITTTPPETIIDIYVERRSLTSNKILSGNTGS